MCKTYQYYLDYVMLYLASCYWLFLNIFALGNYIRNLAVIETIMTDYEARNRLFLRHAISDKI